MMKKLLAMLTAALLAVSLFGCGQTAAGSNESTGTDAASATTKIDYKTTDIKDWVYAPETTDEVTKRLIAIDTTELGSAGSSLKEAAAAVNVMKLSEELLAGDTLAVEAYLDQMTPIQRDYFSFQWTMAFKTANEILTDPTANAPLLEDAGYGDFALEKISADHMNALEKRMTNLLTQRGVTDAWKGFTDVEPFHFAG